MLLNRLHRFPAPIPVLLFARNSPQIKESFHNFWPQNVIGFRIRGGMRLNFRIESERFRPNACSCFGKRRD
jgi:hypothetical protein